MATDPRERAARRFVSRNALVEDPVAALAAERETAAWTPAERRIFLDKFLQFPKVRRRRLVSTISTLERSSRAQKADLETPAWTPAERRDFLDRVLQQPKVVRGLLPGNRL